MNLTKVMKRNLSVTKHDRKKRGMVFFFCAGSSSQTFWGFFPFPLFCTLVESICLSLFTHRGLLTFLILSVLRMLSFYKAGIYPNSIASCLCIIIRNWYFLTENKMNLCLLLNFVKQSIEKLLDRGFLMKCRKGQNQIYDNGQLARRKISQGATEN